VIKIYVKVTQHPCWTQSRHYSHPLTIIIKILWISFREFKTTFPGNTRVIQPRQLLIHTHISHNHTIYIYIHIHTHTLTETYTHTHTHIYIRTYVRTYIHTHTYIHTYVRTYIHTHIWSNIFIFNTMVGWGMHLKSNKCLCFDNGTAHEQLRQ